MTKQGYTHIIVPQNLHDQLKTLAQQNNISISQLINQLINISINVSLNIGINTSINTTQLNQQNLSLLQAPKQDKGLNQAPNTPFSLSEGSLFEKEKVQWAGPYAIKKLSESFVSRPLSNFRFCHHNDTNYGPRFINPLDCPLQ